MARPRFRRAARRRRNLKWTGFNRLSFLQGSTQSETVIFDPAVEDVQNSRPTCLRIRGRFSLIGQTITQDDVTSVMIQTYGTDEIETVVSGFPYTLGAQDIEIAQKSTHFNWVGSPAAINQTPVEIDIDLKVRIRLWPARAIIMTTHHSDNANTVRIAGLVRCLVDWG